ncbi:hypothetical protein I79_013337 [Cricetulus griseus]|uniref:Uncharacterized protein n=1 Tax=Cricetulus griseus TaxID=10029 RepID=G3HR74_CRIGR|nr:hypothetical protein I79_013337 [Cricetulus griseus]
MVSLCGPGYPGTQSVDQAGLNTEIYLPLSPQGWGQRYVTLCLASACFLTPPKTICPGVTAPTNELDSLISVVSQDSAPQTY